MKRFWIVLTVMLPTFIEILDTTINNVALRHIQGSLSAGVDESTWIITSYLVSNAVVIPMAGWLSRVFGRKNYLIFFPYLSLQFLHFYVESPGVFHLLYFSEFFRALAEGVFNL